MTCMNIEDEPVKGNQASRKTDDLLRTAYNLSS